MITKQQKGGRGDTGSASSISGHVVLARRPGRGHRLQDTIPFFGLDEDAGYFRTLYRSWQRSRYVLCRACGEGSCSSSWHSAHFLGGPHKIWVRHLCTQLHSTALYCTLVSGELRQLLERALEKHLPRKHQRGARGQGGIKVQGEGVRADVGGGAGGEGGGVTRGAGVGGEEVEGRLGEGTTSEGGKERAKPAVGTPQHGDSLLLRRLQAGRVGRQVQSADPGALMYLPLGGAGNIR